MKSTLKRTLLVICGLLLIPWSAAQAQTTIRIEAEEMTLTTYQIEAISFASNGALINLKGPGFTGSAIASFPGNDGSYDIFVVCHDENDGEAQLSVSINNNSLDSWTLDQLIPGGRDAIETNRFTREIAAGYNVSNGDEIRIDGLQGNWDHANVDYIEFVAASSGGAPNPPIVVELTDGKPLTIEESGYYVLDRDWQLHLTTDEQTIFEVTADDVTIDMRGFEIDGVDHARVVITGNRVTLRNGALRRTDILSKGEDTHITGMRVYVVDEGVGVSLTGQRGRVDNSIIDAYGDSVGILLLASHAIIQSNEFRIAGHIQAIRVPEWGDPVSFVQITSNTFQCSVSQCIALIGDSNIIASNTFMASEMEMIVVHGNYNQVRDNVYSGLVVERATAITIDGTRNMIRGNIYNPYPDPGDPDARPWQGIHFLKDGNYYGDNLIAAQIPLVFDGTVQIDLGGNQSLEL